MQTSPIDANTPMHFFFFESETFIAKDKHKTIL